MENSSSEDRGGIVMNSKIKSPAHQGPESNTMDSFQDGGNQDRNQGDLLSNMDGAHTNSDMNSYPVTSRDSSIGSDNYGKMNENLPGGQGGAYNANYHRGNFGMGDQHGGLPTSSGNDFSQQNSQYSPYGGQNMHQGYPHPNRTGGMPGRPGMPGAGMGMMSTNYNTGPQRIMSGPNIQQQGGPTPTLNQLLTSASSGQRYQGGYGDYGGTPPKPMPGMGEPGYGNGPQNWQQQRPVSPYQQQLHGNQPYRNQSPMYDGGSGGRRPGMPPGYPGQQSPGQYGAPGQPPSPRGSYPMQPGGGAGPPGPGGRPPQMYGQQNVMASGQMNAAQQSPQAQQQQPPQQYNIQSQPQPPGSSPSPVQPPLSSPDSGSNQSSQQQQNQKSSSQTNSNSQDPNSSDESGEVSGQRTPTPTHPNVNALRPVPSPAGSAGSRSPGSLSGQQAGSPMPPRPPSTQMDGQNRIQSPMPNQGYSQQMMPPPMGPQQIPPYSNKMHGGAPNMMGGPGGPGSMPPYNSQYPGSHPSQGGYMRGQSGMGGYGSPQHTSAGYGSANQMGGPGNQMGGPSNQMGGPGNQMGGPGNQMGGPGNQMGGPGGMYPGGGMGGPNMGNNMSGGMNRQMPNSNFHNSGYPGPGGSMAPGAMSGPGPYSNNNGPNMPPNQTASNNMQPMGNSTSSAPVNSTNNMGANQQSPGPKGAMAAAQAAMIAAANSAQQRSAMYMRGANSSGSGSDSQSPGLPPTTPPGQTSPMPGHPSSGSSSSGPQHNSMPNQQNAMSGPAGQQSSPHSTPSGQHNSMGGSHLGQPGQSNAMGSSHPGASGPHPGPHMAGPHQGGPHPAGGPHPGMGGPHQRMFPGQYPNSGPMGPGNHMGQGGMSLMDNMGGHGPGQQPGYNGGMGMVNNHGNMPNSSGMNRDMVPGMTANRDMMPGNNMSSKSPAPMMPNMSSNSNMATHSSMTSNLTNTVSNSSSINSMSNSQPPTPEGHELRRTGSCNSVHSEGKGPTTNHSGEGVTNVTQSITVPVSSSISSSMAGNSSDSDSMPPPSMNTASSQPGPIPSPSPSDGPPLSKSDSLPNSLSAALSDGGNSNSSFPPSQLHDEESQNSQPDRSKGRDGNMSSHPPTPASIAASPSASMSSLHDDLDNISSPSWPGTPSSTAQPHQTSFANKPTISDSLSRMYDMGDEPERRIFLDKVFLFMEEKGTPVTAMPMISKQPIDLFRLYCIVKEKGGLLEVTKQKKWRDIATAINVGSSGSAGFTLRKNYVKFLFPYECKFERGGIDPGPILAQIDAMSQKKDSKRNSSSGQSQSPMDPFRPPSNSGYDGYDHRMGPPMHGMPNAMMPPPTSGNMMPNNMGYESGMMGPNAGMHNSSNNMMPNNYMNNQMMGGRGMMHNNDGMNAQGYHDNNMGGQYPQRPGMNNQMGPYSGNMPQQNNMNNSPYPPFNRPNMATSPMSQQNYGPDGMNRMGGPSPSGPQSGQYNDPYRRQNMSAPNSMSGPNMSGPNSMPGMNSMSGSNNMPNNMSGPNMGSESGPGFNRMGPNQGQGSSTPPNMQDGFGGRYPNNLQQQGSNIPPTCNSTGGPYTGYSPQPDTRFDSQQGQQQQQGQQGQQPQQQSQQQQQQGPPNSQSQTPSHPPASSTPTSQGPGTPSRPPSATPSPAPGSSPAPTPVPTSSAGGMPPQSPGSQSGSSQPMRPNSASHMQGSSGTPSPMPAASPMGHQSPMPNCSTSQMPAASAGPAMSNTPPMGSQASMSTMNNVPPMGSSPSMCPTSSIGQTSMGNAPPQMGNTPMGNTPGMGNGPQMGSGPHPDYPGRYGGPGNQMMRPHTPQDGYGPNQGGYPGQRPYPQGGDQYGSGQGGYPGQQGQGMYPQKSQMPGGYPAPKQYPDYPHMQSGYSGQGGQPGSYPSGQYPYSQQAPRPPMSQQDSMHPDMRSRNDQWSAMQQQRYGQQHSSAAYSGQQMPPTTSSVPPYGMFNQRMNQRMSPQRPEKSYFSPQKKGPAGTVQSAVKKDSSSFPPDSVEAVQPILAKRKRLTAKDISPLDAWRLMMAIKSGLLAETTWALDALSVLLYDDNTITYFHLQHLPGLIDVLLDHFRCTLREIFGEPFDDLELQTKGDKRQRKRRHRSVSSSSESEGEDDIDLKPPEKKLLETPGNYTLVTRNGTPVKIEKDSLGFEDVYDDKKWDTHLDFESGARLWQQGLADKTNHVLTHFESNNQMEFHRKLFFGAHNNHIKAELKSEELAKGCDRGKKSATEPLGGSNLSRRNSTVDPCDLSSNKLTECTDSKSHISPIKMESDSSKSTASGLDDAGCSNTKSEEEVHIKEEKVDPAYEPAIDKSQTKCSLDQDPAEMDKSTPVKEESMDTEESVNECVNSENCEQVSKDKTSESSSSVKENKSSRDLAKEQAQQEFMDALNYNDHCRAIVEDLKQTFEDLTGEPEAYRRDPTPLCLISDSQTEISRRCVCISNIFRSLSFVPGNDSQLSRHRGLILILSKLLLLHHQHPDRRRSDTHRFNREDTEPPVEEAIEDSISEWWWETLDALRENTLVILSNITGRLNLGLYPNHICYVLLDGLLHWSVCPSAYAHDPMPTMSPISSLTPQRLALEALCKLAVIEVNIDLVLATPPFSRLTQLLHVLIQLLANRKEQVLREFAIVLLSGLVAGNSSAARAVALQHPAISLLLDFIETAEHQALQIANSHGVDMLQDNPEMMGTSIDMLRRTAKIIYNLALVPASKTLFSRQQERLLTLVMSRILDSSVSSILADVLFQCSNLSS